MKTIDVKHRKAVNEIAGQYMAESENGKDFYDQYLTLCGEKLAGNGHDLAVDHINMWQGAESMIVDEVIDLIEGGIRILEEHLQSNHPEVIRNIDWSKLSIQKTDVLHTIQDLEIESIEASSAGEEELSDRYKEQIESLQGIVNLIDALQDYAVDEMNMSENDVYDFEQEEERE